MIFALLTAMLWSCSSYASARCARVVGAIHANHLRLTCALIISCCIWFLADITWQPAYAIFLLAGALHMGLGDCFLYNAYRHLGPRIGILFAICPSPLAALLGEYFLLGTTVNLISLIGILGIIFGVVFAFAPRERSQLTPHTMRWGIASSICFFCGIAGGGVCVRYGNAYIEANNIIPLDTYPKGGLYITGGFLIVSLINGGQIISGKQSIKPIFSEWKKYFPWLCISVLVGPFLGIACYQIALGNVAAGLVQSIICMMPIFMSILTYFIDGDIPQKRFYIGSSLAILASLLLSWNDLTKLLQNFT